MDLPLSSPQNAYVLAGFPGASTSTASRKLTFTQNGKNDVFLAASVAPSIAGPTNGIVRNDQVKADPNAPGAFKASAVPNLIPPGVGRLLRVRQLPLAALPVRLGQRPPGPPLRRRERLHRR